MDAKMIFQNAFFLFFFCNFIPISLKFGPLNMWALGQVMVWRLIGQSWPSLLPRNLLYESHLSKQYNCWSLRWSWSIPCRRCSNYIFILDLTPGRVGVNSIISTPTPTPEVSTPTPTPTPANLQNINSNSNSNSRGFNSNSNSNSGKSPEYQLQLQLQLRRFQLQLQFQLRRFQLQFQLQLWS